MGNQRRRPLIVAVVALAAVWIGCWAGYVIAKHSKMTFAKVAQYERSIDFSKLSVADRLKALQKLVDMINAMSPDERRHWRLDKDLMAQLTDEEKSWLIDAVMPTEMKLALNAFEKLPKEKRQKIIDDAMKKLKELSTDPNAMGNDGGGAQDLSPELQAKVRTMGLNTLYSQSSAETKAELAPLMNEIQNQLESGRLR
jgi:uncharacterized membrane protein